MLHYTQYTVQDVFYKSFKDGGLTYGQVQYLYEIAEGKTFDQMCFDAKLQGVDLRKLVKGAPPGSRSNQGDEIFKDPAAYEDMSQEERDRLTEKMRNDLKGLFGNTGL